MEQAQKAPILKALEQTGKPQMLLIAALCALAALLVFALPRGPAPGTEPAPAISATPTDRQTLIEARLREQVEDLIGTIVGRDKVRAIVSAEIEPDQTRQVSVGEPGTNGTETTTIRSSGQIRRLTVSVMVDGRRVKGPDGVGYQPRTKAELARFTRLARSAVGFDALRGDSLTVETVAFAPAGANASFPGVRAEALLPFARPLLTGLLALAALFLILRTFARGTATGVPVSKPEEIEASQPSMVATFTSDAARSPALRRAGEVVAARPAAAAAVVRQWMSA